MEPGSSRSRHPTFRRKVFRSFPYSALPLRVDFDMEMDVVVDEVGAEEAEEFAGAVVAAVGGAIEFQSRCRCARSTAFMAGSARSSQAMLAMSTVKRALASWPWRRWISPP